jgi:PAS domain-containing protein
VPALQTPTSQSPGPPASTSGPIRAPTLEELETLLRCAADGSLAHAAIRLGISRPAVAKRIRNLEAIAGRPLLERAGQGVRLTDAGAQLVSATPPVFHERDVLLATLDEIRNGGEPSPRLQQLLGHTPVAARAAQRPEARLAVAERLLAFVLAASSSGVVISDSKTSEIHEVNDAFCRFVRRPRHELLGLAGDTAGIWCKGSEQSEAIERIARGGAGERFIVEARRPDGTVASGSACARLIGSAGPPMLVLVVHERPEREAPASG